MTSPVSSRRVVHPPVVAHERAVLSGFPARTGPMLHHRRGEAIAARLSALGKNGVSEIADFLMLQLVNRYEPMVVTCHEAAHRCILKGFTPNCWDWRVTSTTFTVTIGARRTPGVQTTTILLAASRP